MKVDDVVCRQDLRREKVRTGEGIAGLDSVEVSYDQMMLTAFFIGKAPQQIAQANVVVEGGVTIADVKVVGIDVRRRDDPDLDDTMEITLDKFGDYSPYRLRLAALDPNGHATGAPMPGVDPRYAQVDFSFKVACHNDLDCKPDLVCPPDRRPEPEINYLAKDYAGFRQLILDRLALVMPDWRERHAADVGIALVEVLAYVGDYLSYYQDAVATEAYLATARRRISVRRHVRLVDYRLHEGCNGRAWVRIETSADLKRPADEVFFITEFREAGGLSVLRAADLTDVSPESYEQFEPLMQRGRTDITLYAAHSTILFYTGGDRECCLARGATRATINDWNPNAPRERALKLAAGDVLIFEEVIGPKTGDPADADPTHRHAVMLTRVTPHVDVLYDRPVLEIEWAQADALPFPFCLSTLGPAPDCKMLVDVSVARGNVVLVEQGRRVDEPLGTVPLVDIVGECDECGCPPETSVVAGPYRPSLGQSPLSFGMPFHSLASAAEALVQDPRRARPEIWLTGTEHQSSGDIARSWTERPDLLESGPEDRDYIVEVEESAQVWLRFGDGRNGRLPNAETDFAARYRVGNGPSGNVGRDTIRIMILRKGDIVGGAIAVTNPMAAVGGTLPEPTEVAKLFAPQAYRSDIARAITPQDYATVARRHSGVQRAAAALYWTGSWYETRVAVDPLGTDDPRPRFLEDVDDLVEGFRRVGQDVRITPPFYVPLDILMEVCVAPDYLKAHVEAALLELFSDRVLPDGRLGFFHPDNLTFGQGIAKSRMYALAQTVPGVAGVTMLTFEREFGARLHRFPEHGEIVLGPLEIAQVDNDPARPDRGSLAFEMRGGR